MTRSTRLAATAALVLCLPTMAACGTTRAGAGAVSESAPVAAPIPTDPVAAHDKDFPGIAAGCPATAASEPAPTEPSALPTDPEAAKYAENHAYRQTSRLTPAMRCRGDAHALRIRQALTRPGATTPTAEAELESVLKGLGYRSDSHDAHVYRTGGALAFTLFIPGAGPCVTGTPTDPDGIKAHGAYGEGGCIAPSGGH
ncbi:hypothetical protein [Streptomyces sp. NPDC058623]|uniref:hypothetical protein n=1 Tax=Streptomyces sp. NPDC058623 TaxID=3346563 RepID=UPI003665957F